MANKGKSMRARLIKWIRKTYRMTDHEARKYYNACTPEQKQRAALEMQHMSER